MMAASVTKWYWLQHPRGLGNGEEAGTVNPLQLQQFMLSTSPSQRREDGFGESQARRPYETEGGVL